MDFKLDLKLDKPNKEVTDRVRMAEEKKRLKEYQPTLDEVFISGYMTHTGKRKKPIFETKMTDTDKARLKAVYEAIKDGTLGTGVDDMKKFSKSHALKLYQELVSLQRSAAIKKMIAEKPRNYILVDSVIKLKQVVDWLEDEETIAVDTETTGVDVYRDNIVGVSLTMPKADRHVYIPFGHTVEGKQLPESVVLDAIRPALEDEDIKKVFHNAKFDIHMFIRHGIRVRGLYWDTMIAMILLNENEPSMALKNLATKYGQYFGFEDKSMTYEELFGRGGFENTPLDIGSIYAIKDTHLTHSLYRWQYECFTAREDLKAILDYFLTVEMPLLDVVVDMEQTGFTLDMERVEQLREEYQAEVDRLAEEMRFYFGDTNFNSPSQLAKKIYEEWGLTKHVKHLLKYDRAKGDYKYSVDAKILKALAKHNKGIELLLEYREKNKLLTTYIEAMPKQLSPDGKIHATFNQAGTVTGRFSSQNPNLQNITGSMRKMFVAPEGKVILAGDFSQQEVRFLAHFTKEPALVEAYQTGQDLYAKSASETFGKPIEECGDGSKYRKMMKFGVLSVMYGTGEATLADQLGITEAEAGAFIKRFYEKNQRVAEWIKENVMFVHKHKYVEIMGGRKRRLPDIMSPEVWTRAKAERQATNARIQGSAAVQTKVTMLRLAEWCKRKGWQLLFTIHDEVAVLADDTLTREDVKEFEDIMINSFKLDVPNKTDIVIEKRWSESYTVDEWFDRQK